jgi:hypothetical protein
VAAFILATFFAASMVALVSPKSKLLGSECGRKGKKIKKNIVKIFQKNEVGLKRTFFMESLTHNRLLISQENI